MTDTAFVRSTMVAPEKPPRRSTGLFAWLRARLF